MSNIGNNRYVASLPPDRSRVDPNLVQIVRWMYEELQRVSGAITSLDYQYEPLSAPPARVSLGMVVYADGTNWNPGSGEGLYVYKSDATWHLLG